MRNAYVKFIAIGGVLAALAVVIMFLGGFIPIATFIIPVICTILLYVVCRICGPSIAWAWFAAVAILGLLLSPDKESATVFLALGYYPIVRKRMEKLPFSLLFKLVLFNAVVLLLYTVLIHWIGMEHLVQEFGQLGMLGAVVTLVLGNVTFFVLDLLLKRLDHMKEKPGRSR